MTIQRFLSILFRKVWLILPVTLVFAAVGYYIALQIPPNYEVETRLLVGSVSDSRGGSSAQQNANQIAQAHALLIKEPSVVSATADAVHFPGGWQKLFDHVFVQVAGSQIIQITVRDSDPKRARAIAEELARQLILQSPLNAQKEESEKQRAFVENQQRSIQSDIAQSQQKLDALNRDTSLETDTKRIQELNLQIDALQNKIDNWRRDYAALSGLIENRSTTFVTVLTPATEPIVSTSGNTVLVPIIAGLIGLMLGCGTALLWDYLDKRIKNTEVAERELHLPVIGTIARIKGARQPADNLVTLRQPISPASEAFRVLRTNLRFSGVENPGGLLLITSASSAEGRTTTVANLGVTLAQAGKRVIIVDSDLRQPALHKLFGLSNAVGLGNLLRDHSSPIDRALQATFVEGLRILTSGMEVVDPSGVLDSKRMKNILDHLRAESDMVILDSPPALGSIDASILSSLSSGTILVVDAGKTRSDVARRALRTLNWAHTQLLGIVINKLADYQSAYNMPLHSQRVQIPQVGNEESNIAPHFSRP